MISQDELKRAVAQAAVRHVQPGAVLGVGTGSTVDLFIDALAAGGHPGFRLQSRAPNAAPGRLTALGIRVDRRSTRSNELPVYIDGADEIDARFCMIKGGGAALTREKIVADRGT